MSISIRAYLFACLHKWYWFVISVIALGCIGYLYGKMQPQTYSSSAQMIIKTSANEGSGTEKMFADLGRGAFNTSITNETYVLKSNRVLEDVAKKLNMDVAYYCHKFLRDVNVSKSSPVVVMPITDVKESFSMKMRHVSDSVVEVSIGGAKPIKARYGNKITCNKGVFLLSKSAQFSEQTWKS